MTGRVGLVCGACFDLYDLLLISERVDHLVPITSIENGGLQEEGKARRGGRMYVCGFRGRQMLEFYLRRGCLGLAVVLHTAADAVGRTTACCNRLFGGHVYSTGRDYNPSRTGSPFIGLENCVSGNHFDWV